MNKEVFRSLVNSDNDVKKQLNPEISYNQMKYVTSNQMKPDVSQCNVEISSSQLAGLLSMCHSE